MVMDRDGMAAMLEQVVSTLYPERVVPPGEGGFLFHAVCDERRRAGDTFWTERRLHDLARELGFWPWSFTQIEVDLRKRHPLRGEPEETVLTPVPFLS
jgi:hypothetical protein